MAQVLGSMDHSNMKPLVPQAEAIHVSFSPNYCTSTTHNKQAQDALRQYRAFRCVS
jgi:hypothetical protein